MNALLFYILEFSSRSTVSVSKCNKRIECNVSCTSRTIIDVIDIHVRRSMLSDFLAHAYPN